MAKIVDGSPRNRKIDPCISRLKYSMNQLKVCCGYERMDQRGETGLILMILYMKNKNYIPKSANHLSHYKFAKALVKEKLPIFSNCKLDLRIPKDKNKDDCFYDWFIKMCWFCITGKYAARKYLLLSGSNLQDTVLLFGTVLLLDPVHF